MANSYSKEFKEDAVSYVRSHPELSISKCAKQLGVNANTLHTWLSKAKAGYVWQNRNQPARKLKNQPVEK